MPTNECLRALSDFAATHGVSLGEISAMGPTLQKIENRLASPKLREILRELPGNLRLIGVPASSHRRDAKHWLLLYYRMLLRRSAVSGDERYVLAYFMRSRRLKPYALRALLRARVKKT